MTDTVTEGFYLIISEAHPKRGYKKLDFRVVATTDKTPATKANEIAMLVNVELPRALFHKPSLKGSITVPPGSTRAPVIAADVVAGLEDDLKKLTGFDITLKVAK